MDTSCSVGHHARDSAPRTDGAHAVVQAPGPQPPLRDLKPAALPQQHVAGRHAHALRAAAHPFLLEYHMRSCLLSTLTTRHAGELAGSQPGGAGIEQTNSVFCARSMQALQETVQVYLGSPTPC